MDQRPGFFAIQLIPPNLIPSNSTLLLDTYNTAELRPPPDSGVPVGYIR